MAESDEKRCPHCAEVIKKEARVCKHCGRDLTPKPYRPPVWSNRPPPYWKEEVKKRAWDAVVAYHTIPLIIGLVLSLVIYLPGAVSGCQRNKKNSKFYSLERRIGRGEELSDIELKEYFECVTDEYRLWKGGKNDRVDKDVIDIAKRIDDETHTIWINPEEWDNRTLHQRLIIRNALLYFFIKHSKKIPYCTIKSVEDDSVIATARGMTNREILREKD